MNETKVLFYFATESSFVAAEARLSGIGAIVVDIAPHLIEARLTESQIEGMLANGGSAYVSGAQIPKKVLDAMPLDVRAYAKAFMAPPPNSSDTDGYSWNVFEQP